MANRSGMYAKIPQFSYQKIDTNFIKFTNIPLYAKPENASDGSGVADQAAAAGPQDSAATTGNTPPEAPTSAPAADPEPTLKEETPAAETATQPPEPLEVIENNAAPAAEAIPPPAPDAPPAPEAPASVEEQKAAPETTAAESPSDAPEILPAAPEVPVEQSPQETAKEPTIVEDRISTEPTTSDAAPPAAEKEIESATAESSEPAPTPADDASSTPAHADSDPAPISADDSPKLTDGEVKGKQKSAMKSKKGNKVASVSFLKPLSVPTKPEPKPEKSTKGKEKKVAKVLVKEKKSNKGSKKLSAAVIVPVVETVEAPMATDSLTGEGEHEVANDVEIVESASSSLSPPEEGGGESKEPVQPDPIVQETEGDSSLRELSSLADAVEPANVDIEIAKDEPKEATNANVAQAEDSQTEAVASSSPEDTKEPPADEQEQQHAASEDTEKETNTELGDKSIDSNADSVTEAAIAVTEESSREIASDGDTATIKAEDAEKTEVAPIEPTPSESTPTEPTPAEPTPSELTPIEPTPTESTPAEPISDHVDILPITEAPQESSSTSSTTDHPTEALVVGAIVGAALSKVLDIPADSADTTERKVLDNESDLPEVTKQDATKAEKVDQPPTEVVVQESQADAPKELLADNERSLDDETFTIDNPIEETSSDKATGDPIASVPEQGTPVIVVPPTAPEGKTAEAAPIHAAVEDLTQVDAHFSVTESETHPETEVENSRSLDQPGASEETDYAHKEIDAGQIAISETQDDQTVVTANQEQVIVDVNDEATAKLEDIVDTPANPTGFKSPVGDSDGTHGADGLSTTPTAEQELVKDEEPTLLVTEHQVISNVSHTESIPSAEISIEAAETSKGDQPEQVATVEDITSHNTNEVLDSQEGDAEDLGVAQKDSSLAPGDAEGAIKDDLPEDVARQEVTEAAGDAVNAAVLISAVKDELDSSKPEHEEPKAKSVAEVDAPADTTTTEEPVIDSRPDLAQSDELKMDAHPMSDEQNNAGVEGEEQSNLRETLEASIPASATEDLAHDETAYSPLDQKVSEDDKIGDGHYDHSRTIAIDTGVIMPHEVEVELITPKTGKPRVRRSRTERVEDVPKASQPLRLEKRLSKPSSSGLGSIGLSLRPKLFDGVKAESEIGQHPRSGSHRESTSPISPTKPSIRRSRTEPRESSNSEKRHSRTVEDIERREAHERRKERAARNAASAEADRRRARYDGHRSGRGHGEVQNEDTERSGHRRRREVKDLHDVPDEYGAERSGVGNFEPSAAKYEEARGDEQDDKQHRSHRHHHHHHRHHSKRLSPTTSQNSDRDKTKDKERSERSSKTADDSKKSGGILKRIFGA